MFVSSSAVEMFGFPEFFKRVLDCARTDKLTFLDSPLSCAPHGNVLAHGRSIIMERCLYNLSILYLI